MVSSARPRARVTHKVKEVAARCVLREGVNPFRVLGDCHKGQHARLARDAQLPPRFQLADGVLGDVRLGQAAEAIFHELLVKYFHCERERPRRKRIRPVHRLHKSLCHANPAVLRLPQRFFNRERTPPVFEHHRPHAVAADELHAV